MRRRGPTKEGGPFIRGEHFTGTVQPSVVTLTEDERAQKKAIVDAAHIGRPRARASYAAKVERYIIAARGKQEEQSAGADRVHIEQFQTGLGIGGQGLDGETKDFVAEIQLGPEQNGPSFVEGDNPQPTPPVAPTAVEKVETPVNVPVFNDDLKNIGIQEDQDPAQ